MLRLLAPAALALASLSASASALPLPSPPEPVGTAQIIPVYGGCGVYRHRGPYGGCRPGGQWGGYIPGRSCPPGWHIGPYGHRCWRNFY